MTIATKSTAQLIDETVTAALRAAHADAESMSARAERLIEALGCRIGVETGAMIFDLAIILTATWQAQEVVMADRDDTTTAAAARQAQRLNAHRTRLIRRIDELLGEDGITVLTKTYDRSAT